MKQLIITIAILLMPISATRLHAQENKHAQALRTAFVETLDKRFPKNISSRWIRGSKDDSLSIIYTALDGGGLVPKNTRITLRPEGPSVLVTAALSFSTPARIF